MNWAGANAGPFCNKYSRFVRWELRLLTSFGASAPPGSVLSLDESSAPNSESDCFFRIRKYYFMYELSFETFRLAPWQGLRGIFFKQNWNLRFKVLNIYCHPFLPQKNISPIYPMIPDFWPQGYYDGAFLFYRIEKYVSYYRSFSLFTSCILPKMHISPIFRMALAQKNEFIRYVLSYVLWYSTHPIR